MKKDFSNQKHKKIAVRERNSVHLVDISSIFYIKCDGYITTINILGSKPIITTKLLKEFEIELDEFGFIRANRSSLVNMAVVKKYIGGSKRILELINGDQIKVSRRRVFNFKDFHSFV